MLREGLDTKYFSKMPDGKEAGIRCYPSLQVQISINNNHSAKSAKNKGREEICGPEPGVHPTPILGNPEVMGNILIAFTLAQRPLSHRSFYCGDEAIDVSDFLVISQIWLKEGGLTFEDE